MKKDSVDTSEPMLELDDEGAELLLDDLEDGDLEVEPSDPEAEETSVDEDDVTHPVAHL